MAPSQNNSVELLAPAGDWQCARAAVENGADAIYFGLEKFNARMRAENFTVADLPELMRFLHLRGVRGYVTFNTLIFESELDEARQMILAIAAAGVDAVIVQDLGLCRLIRETVPDFPIHASTQMTITSAAGVEFAKKLGCELVVLARECSLAEIEKLRNETAVTGNSLPLEIFVHGALCVAYSGQCLTSEALGGRSANRGECAQACRMPYEMVVDGKPHPLPEQQYLLSPQDLSGIELIPQIIKSGICSVKIEGRLKSPLYVASVTRTYREALDRAFKGTNIPGVTTATKYELEMAFSRGLSTGWLGGIDNQKLVHARYPKKRGAFVGTVIFSGIVSGREEVKINLTAPLALGDGIVFDCGDPQAEEEGGRIYEIAADGRTATLRFKNNQINTAVISPGSRVYKTSDPQLERELRATYSGEKPRTKQPVRISVAGRAGELLTVSMIDRAGNTVETVSELALAPASSRPLDRNVIEEKLGALGDTSYTAETFEIDLPDTVFLPLPELKRIRRVLVEKLDQVRTRPRSYKISSRQSRNSFVPRKIPSAPALAVLARTEAQLQAALASGVGRIYLDFESVKRYREGVQTCRESQTGVEVFVAPPRIFKTGEEWILRQVGTCGADGILVRNFDHLKYFKESRLAADFSFNIANSYSAEYLASEPGVEILTPSYDLNVKQLLALFQSADPSLFEVTIHQRMPMFHMEHCVFCAFLSKGKDYRDCGRPCDDHEVKLRDRTGSDLFLKADTGCRNTVFNSKAQTGAEFLGQFLEAGCSRFRVDLVDEDATAAKDVIRRYQALLRGDISPTALWRELKLVSQLGVTRGQLGNPNLPVI